MAGPATAPRVPAGQLGDVPGLPESRLSIGDLALLPPDSPPAPWTCRARAVLWWQRASTPLIRHPAGARALPLATVAFVDYLDSPVGGYHEVLGGIALVRRGRPLGQVPFIAVDSRPSVHGGRANWALPKTVAQFGGDLTTGRASARGDGWSVQVSPVSRPGPAVPLRAAFMVAGPLGDYRTTLRGTGRPLVLRSGVDGESIGPWLGSGRHLGLLLSGEMTIEAPRPR